MNSENNIQKTALGKNTDAVLILLILKSIHSLFTYMKATNSPILVL